VPGTPPPLVPAQGERGLSSHQPADVAALLEPAWASLERLAERIDLDASTRLPGWTARQVLVRCGTWPDGDTADDTPIGSVADRISLARSGNDEPVEDAESRTARLLASHHDASRSEVLAALRRARRDTSSYLLSEDAVTIGTRPVQSVVGELPLTGLIVARAYELAVHSIDLLNARQAGTAVVDAPDDNVLVAGLAALVDVTGALAARQQLTVTFAVLTPVAVWAVGVAGEDWTTARIDVGPGRSLGWPSVEGTAVDVLDASAGRASAAQLLLTRRLRVNDVPSLLQLLPALEGAPGLPGGAGIRAATRVLAGAGQAVSGLTSRLPGWR